MLGENLLIIIFWANNLRWGWCLVRWGNIYMEKQTKQPPAHENKINLVIKLAKLKINQRTTYPCFPLLSALDCWSCQVKEVLPLIFDAVLYCATVFSWLWSILSSAGGEKESRFICNLYGRLLSSKMQLQSTINHLTYSFEDNLALSSQ